jgi:hypothetical protein
MRTPSTPNFLVCSMIHLIWVFKLSFKRGQGCLRCDLWQTNLRTQSEGPTSGLDPLWRSFPFLVNSWFRQSNRKVLVDYPLPTRQVKRVMYGATSRSVHVGKVIHRYMIKYFQKDVFTVTNDLGADVMIIENFNLIIKFGK